MPNSFAFAYLLPTVSQLLKKHFQPEIVEALLQFVAMTEVSWQINQATKPVANDTIFYLLENYLGHKVLQNPENELVEIMQSKFADFWEQDEATLAQLLFNALHIIEPRLNAISAAAAFQESWEKLGTRFEQDFIHKDLPLAAGDYWIQLFEQQKTFENLPEPSQKVDYVLQFPYKIEEKRGLWIEIDGELHNTEKQKAIDEQRNNYALQQNWLSVWRIKTIDFNLIHRQIVPLQYLMQQDYFQCLKQNYKHPLTNTETGLDALQVLLSPVAVAKIHKILINSILQGVLSLQHRVWHIAILEQDVPCANLAIETFTQLVQQIFDLEGENRSLPNIELTIITTRKYEYARLNKNINKTFIGEYIEKPFARQPFDLLIDMAILQRKSWNLAGNYTILAQTKVTVRSSFSSAADLPQKTYLPIALQHFLPTILQKQNNTFLQNLVKNSLNNSQLCQNNYFTVLQIADNQTINEQLFLAQYENLLAKNNRQIIDFQDLVNSAILHQLTVNTSAIHKIWLSFALIALHFNHTNTIADKLLAFIENQLFEGFYECHFDNYQVFKNFYDTYTQKLLTHIAPINHATVKNLVEKQQEKLQIIPHINWLKGFVKRFVVL